MAETDQEEQKWEADKKRIRGFVHVYDWLDWLLALLVALTTWALLTVFASPVLHPGFWADVAVASGTRPPDSTASGLGIALAKAVFAHFGVEGGISLLMRLGHATGALLVGLSYLLMRGLFSARLAVKPEELLALSMRLRWLAVAGALVFACSAALWLRMQFLSGELLCFLFGVVAIIAFDRFRRRRNLGWHCLCSLATGLLAAETPIGLALAAGIHLWNRRERKLYWAQRGALKVLVRDPNDPDAAQRGGRTDAVVTFNAGKADDPMAFFDDELEDEIKKMAFRQETWLSGLMFVTGFVVALTIAGRAFSELGGLAVKDGSAWEYPVMLVSTWYRQMRQLANPYTWLFSSAFSLFPFGIVYVLVTRSTDDEYNFKVVTIPLILLMGLVAWLQLSPFVGFWYWTWDLRGVGNASESLRAFMAFFGAAAVTGAFQVACCTFRRQMMGARKIMVEEGVVLARLRRSCRWLLALAVVLVVVLSACGRRQVDVHRKLELVGEYVKAFAAQTQGLGWIFTDGAFDDALAIALRAQGAEEPHPLSMMSGRNSYASHLRKRTAEDDEDRRVLEVGTLETLRFWAAERKERLSRVAMQLGFEVLVKCHVTDARSAGLMLRIGTPDDDAAFDHADDVARELSEKALKVADDALSGNFDQEVSDKFDFILWRLARMAELRMKQYLLKEDGPSAARERELAQRLDAANGPYRLLKSKLERKGNDDSFVLSPQEGLAIALKRGDFNLARPFANRMLRLDPGDSNANFAIGMWAIENRLYGIALTYLESALSSRPEEPSILNNLAMVRFKLGDLEAARKLIEHAVKVNPESREIQQNLKRIRQGVPKTNENARVARPLKK